MAIRQILQNGTTANDGTGDSLRQAANKINTNFRDLYLLFGDSVNATTQISFDSDGRVVFDGGTYNTIFGANTPTGSNKYINLPDSSGTVVLQDTTDTLTNKTILDPIINDVTDTNGNLILTFSPSVGATNDLKLMNGDSSTGVTLGVDGTLADVDLVLSPLQNGVVKTTSYVVPSQTEILTTASVAADPRIPITFLNKGTAGFAVSLADGLNVGEIKTFISINSTTAEITPASFVNTGGTRVDVAQYGVCSLIWTGTNWHVHSISSDTDVTIA